MSPKQKTNNNLTNIALMVTRLTNIALMVTRVTNIAQQNYLCTFQDNIETERHDF